jgi:predicted RNase H-like HicB family nuclease
MSASSNQEVVVRIQVILEPSDEGGFTATVPVLPGCISEGRTREATLRNIGEAIRLYVEPTNDPDHGPSAEVHEITV